jgi:hypothetical protein
LTACDPATIASTFINITFSDTGEAWTGMVEVHILPEGVNDAAETFPGLISDLQEQARIAGVDATVDWRVGEVDQNGNTIYHVEIVGETLDELNALMSSEAAFTTRIIDGQTRWYFQLDPNDLIPDVINNWQFQLSGREIITGNGTLEDQNTMRWNTIRSDMTAVLITEEKRIIFWPYLIIALCVTGLAATFLHQRGVWRLPAWIKH